MRAIIFYICFGLYFIVSSAYAEDLVLKGSFFPGTKYVSSSFKPLGKNNIYYDIVFNKYDEKSLNIINELVSICNGNDNKKCEILASIKKLTSNDMATGIITDIKYINGINTINIDNNKDEVFVNKYNECLKSSKKLLKLSESSTELMKKAESILNKNDMDQLRRDFRTSHSISKNNPAEQMSKYRNISLCDAYIELNIDFIDMAKSYINQKIAENDKIDSIEIDKDVTIATNRQENNKEYQYIFDKNPICPNIYGLYLGMDKNMAINILKSIANKDKLYFSSKENKDYINIKLSSPTFITPDDKSGTIINLQIYIGNEYQSKIDKVTNIFYNINILKKIGFTYDSLLDSFMTNCTNGLDKNIIINQYNNNGSIFISAMSNNTSDMINTFTKDAIDVTYVK